MAAKQKYWNTKVGNRTPKSAHDVMAERRYLKVLRQQYDAKIVELRKQRLVNWQILPTEDEMSWMREDERKVVEWFDRHEYDVFMDRARFHRHQGGWIVRFCQYICIAKGLVPDRRRHNWHCMLNSSLDDIISAAKSGNGRAQYSLGLLYELGYEGGRRYVPCHIDRAWDWYKKSAENGCILGQKAYANRLNGGRSWGQLLCMDLARTDYHFWRGKIVRRNGVYFGGLPADVGKTLDWETLSEKVRQSGQEDAQEALKWYNIIAERGDIQMCYDLACKLIAGDGEIRDIVKGAKWVRVAAQAGFPKATEVVLAASGDMSDARIAAELHIALLLEKCKEREQLKNIGDKCSLQFEIFENSAGKEFGDDWLLEDRPTGTTVPPPSGRGEMRTPKLQSANPSFAARLIAYVRDKFDGDAPKVYRSAHVNRKTYSSIVSNELRPVSKQTAIAFSLALHLSEIEMSEFLRSAGYALSEFLLEDMIVQACSRAGIYDVQKVNEILAAHDAKPLSC